MAHAIDFARSTKTLIALVDPSAPSPSKAPLTGQSKRVNLKPPAFTVAATWANFVQLMQTLPGAVLTDAARSWAGKQAALAGALDWGEMDTSHVPEGLRPYPWQLQAARRYRDTARLMLSDEPGTGKTISAVLAVSQPGEEGPATVVCPASVVPSWQRAFAAWAPEKEVHIYAGAKRKKLLDTTGVLIMSYDIAARDAEDVIARGIGHLIIDEHHLIKNRSTKRSQALRKMAQSARGVIALSGTPITHHPGDLFSVLSCLEPGTYPSNARFEARYLDIIPSDYGKIVNGFNPSRRAEFDVCIAPMHRRVAKADVLAQLPPKVYSVREVDIPPKYRKAYDQFASDMIVQLPDSGDQLNAMNVLTQIAHLQMLAAGPCDVETETVTDETTGMEIERQHVKLRDEGSWKVDALLELLDERPGQSIAVFSPSRQLIDRAGEALDDLGISTARVVGDQRPGERDRDIRRFQSGEARVILVTTGAGGVGITLTRAQCAVFLSRPWSLVEATQAEDRIHRIGSEVHDSVDIIDIVAADTIDARIRAALVDKAENLGDVLRDPRIVKELLGGKK